MVSGRNCARSISSQHRITHREFYARTLAELIGHGHRRVLISGSADFNMLEQVYAAFEVAGAAPGITFVDRCPTPVALAEWYATRTKRAVTATASDILDYEDEPFDLICTHSFMGYFTDEGRKVLARKWASLRRPGGKVFTINRIRPAHDTSPKGAPLSSRAGRWKRRGCCSIPPAFTRRRVLKTTPDRSAST